MKKFLSLFLLISLCSCKKNTSNTSVPQDLVTTCTFSSNGTNYTFPGSSASLANQGSLILRSGSVNGYIFSSHYPVNNSISNSITLFISTDYPSVTTYNPPSVSYRGESVLNGISAVIRSSDNSTISITSIHDSGYADGTFSCTMSDANSPNNPPINITNGVFKNVKILQ